MNESIPSKLPEDRARFFWVMPVIAGGIVLLMGAATVWVSLRLGSDARIPIHWNGRGEINGWAGKGGLWIIPAVSAVELALFVLIPFFEPRRGKKLLESKAYGAVVLGIIVVMASVQIGVISASLGKSFPMNHVIFTAIGGLFLVIGCSLAKVKSNFVMGVRNPWTLSSDLSWDKTHRLAGKLFVLYGLILIVAGWIPAKWDRGIWVIVGGGVALVGVISAYSYRVWKNDPDREPAPKSKRE